MNVRTIALTGLLASLAGCSSLTRPPPVDRLFDDSDAQVRFGHERQHLNGVRPKLGLAMSGGGTKAAVFSHGVLHGLHDGGILPRVDIVSTASGGGYAAYWYFTKRMELGEKYATAFADCFPAWMFSPSQFSAYAPLLIQARKSATAVNMEVCDDPGHISKTTPGDPYRWQAHIIRWPDVFKPGITQPLDNQQVFPTFNTVVGVLATLIEAPASLLVAPDDSFVGSSYQYGVERAWGLNPVERDANMPERWEYTNGSRIDPRYTRDLLHVDPAKMQWSDLQAQYGRQSHLPLWILNTTEGQKSNGEPKSENLFEITPFSFGSPQWGYEKEGPSNRLGSLSRGVRASAGFADSQGIGDEDQVRIVERLARIFPAATWGVPFEHPRWPEKLRLSDGGGADNLALVSAARRDLDDIIVVDTAQDATGRMEDVCWSRELLRQSGYTLEFPKLLGLEKVCATQIKTGSGDQPPLDTEKFAYNVSAWLNPVVEGTIRKDGASKTTNVWLIKAAWNEMAVWKAATNPSDQRCGFMPGELNCFLPLFWLSQFNSERQNWLTFPQHGTASMTLNGRSNLTLAYRELGRMLALHLSQDSNGKLSLRTPNCVQRAIKMVPKSRPEPRPLFNTDTPIPSCPKE